MQLSFVSFMVKPILCFIFFFKGLLNTISIYCKLTSAARRVLFRNTLKPLPPRRSRYFSVFFWPLFFYGGEGWGRASTFRGGEAPALLPGGFFSRRPGLGRPRLGPGVF